MKKSIYTYQDQTGTRRWTTDRKAENATFAGTYRKENGREFFDTAPHAPLSHEPQVKGGWWSSAIRGI